MLALLAAGAALDRAPRTALARRKLDDAACAETFAIAANLDEVNGTHAGSQANPIAWTPGCAIRLDLAADAAAYLTIAGFSEARNGSLPALSYAWDVNKTSAATPATFFSWRTWPEFDAGRGTVYDWYYWPLEHDDALVFYEGVEGGNATEDYYRCYDRCDYEHAAPLAESCKAGCGQHARFRSPPESAPTFFDCSRDRKPKAPT